MGDTAYSRINPDGTYRHYNTNISELIFAEDVTRMWKLCALESERVLLSLIWHTGARPAELLDIKAKDVEWGLDRVGTPYFAIRCKNLKMGGTKDFIIRERVLKSTRPMGKDANIFIETVIRWTKHLLPEEYLLFDWRSTRSINRIMHRIAERIGKQWSPYHWRHSTMTHLAASGLGLTELQYWKGAKSVHSVAMYLHAKPAYIMIQNVRKERDRMSLERQVSMPTSTAPPPLSQTPQGEKNENSGALVGSSMGKAERKAEEGSGAQA